MSSTLSRKLSIWEDITKSLNNGFQHTRNGFVIIITIGFEEISKFLFFSCPCERPWNFRYGLLFIFGPAFLLWLVGILAQEKILKSTLKWQNKVIETFKITELTGLQTRILGYSTFIVFKMTILLNSVDLSKLQYWLKIIQVKFLQVWSRKNFGCFWPVYFTENIFNSQIRKHPKFGDQIQISASKICFIFYPYMTDPSDILNSKRWWRKPVAFSRIMIGIAMKGIMVPACWILICFLRGDYYVCAFYPDPDPVKPETLTMPCEMHKVSFLRIAFKDNSFWMNS